MTRRLLAKLGLVELVWILDSYNECTYLRIVRNIGNKRMCKGCHGNLDIELGPGGSTRLLSYHTKSLSLTWEPYTTQSKMKLKCHPNCPFCAVGVPLPNYRRKEKH